MIESSVWLKSSSAQEDKDRKAVEELKRKNTKLESDLAATRKRIDGLSRHGDGRKGADKGGGNGDYGKFGKDSGRKDADPYKSVFLTKDPGNGKEYCRAFNQARGCTRKDCKNYHACNFKDCPNKKDRASCPGAHTHRKFGD